MFNMEKIMFNTLIVYVTHNQNYVQHTSHACSSDNNFMVNVSMQMCNITHVQHTNHSRSTHINKQIKNSNLAVAAFSVSLFTLFLIFTFLACLSFLAFCFFLFPFLSSSTTSHPSSSHT